MTLHQVFINAAGRLRSGWRLVIFVLLFIALLLLLGTGIQVVYGLMLNFRPSLVPPPFVHDLIYRLLLLISALIAGAICNRWLEGLPWRALGLSFTTGWWRDLLIGSLGGVIFLSVAVAIATAGGGLKFTLSTGDILLQVTQTLLLTIVLFLFAALAEEAMFRGYPLQTLTRAHLAWLAILLTSVPFGAAHLRNPNVAHGFTFINTVLAGVWLAVAYLRTRTLWFPVGLHWAWNWTLASVFGLPVSGITNLSAHPLLRGVDVGPAWLTGGSYGIEGGVACTITLVVATIFIWKTRLLSATDEMKKLTSNENPVAAYRVSSPSIQADPQNS